MDGNRTTDSALGTAPSCVSRYQDDYGNTVLRHMRREETNLATSKTTRSTDDEQALQEYIEAADAAELALKRDKAAAAEGQWLQVGLE
jgi:hypothetical protein